MYLCLTELSEIELFICMKMDWAINNLQWLLCHQTKPNQILVKNHLSDHLGKAYNNNNNNDSKQIAYNNNNKENLQNSRLCCPGGLQNKSEVKWKEG